MWYTARNKKTKKEKPIELLISEVDDWEKANPQWEIAITSCNIHSGLGLGVRRPDDGFRDVLKTIKKSHPRSTINVENVGQF